MLITYIIISLIMLFIHITYRIDVIIKNAINLHFIVKNLMHVIYHSFINHIQLYKHFIDF